MTPEVWRGLFQAYMNWDPAAPDAPTVEQLAADFGVSKNAFYAEMKRRGLPLKRNGESAAAAEAERQAEVGTHDLSGVVDLLVEARLESRLKDARIERLIVALEQAGLPIPD